MAAVTTGAVFNYGAFRGASVAALLPQLQQIMTEHALEIAAEVGIGFDPSIINARAAEWARRYTYDMVGGLVDKTRNDLQRLISTFIESPDMTHKQLAKLLEPTFGEVRSKMISVTETTRAYSAATVEYQQELAELGLEMVRVWKTAADDRVCPICAPLDEAPEPSWPADFQDGEHPPAHVNCRCGDGLTALPLDQLDQRWRDRQAELADALGAEWAGPEPGGQS